MTMQFVSLRKWIAAAALLAVAAPSVDFAHAQRPGRPAPKTWDDVVDGGVAYLKKSQAEDGTWSQDSHKGLTGLVLTGLFRSGKVTADDPQAAKGLTFIESLVSKEDGHLANAEGLFHTNYVTTVNLNALQASGLDKYADTINNAVNYIKQSQLDEGEDKQPYDLEYGGFGYNPGTRPDMSNTHFALDALTNAGTPSSDPVFQKAMVFVSRAQNLGSEHNKQPWADKLNDGSFIYVLAARRGGDTPEDAPRPGYGSMTYAGLKSLKHGGVAEDDPRRVKAKQWLAKNYSVDYHPGRDDGAGGQGYFYYLMTMAKSLNYLGEDVVVTEDGKEHNWREEITRALTNRQKEDGSWGNDFGNWLERNPDLCTAYALITLSYTKPQETVAAQ